MDTKSYEKLKILYAKYFTLGYLNTDINRKFGLISLVCYVTNKLKEKDQSVTHLLVLQKINADLNLPEDFIQSLSIICEDFSYGCKDFPTFNIKPSEMIDNIKEILKSWIPF